MIKTPCPLCSSTGPSDYHTDAYRDYLICPVCDLVFAHPNSLLSREEEFRRYEFHENNLEDAGYRTFLQKLCAPMLQRLNPESKGLDFGSGPGPLLQRMFEEQGHDISIYDSFYATDISVFDYQYDFITTSEVVEHLHRPWDELSRLWRSLKPGGHLGIMTSMRHAEIDFSSWHYKKDDTHVIFFSPKTMQWLAECWDAKLEVLNHSVVIFQKDDVTDPREDSNPRLV